MVASGVVGADVGEGGTIVSGDDGDDDGLSEITGEGAADGNKEYSTVGIMEGNRGTGRSEFAAIDGLIDGPRLGSVSAMSSFVGGADVVGWGETLGIADDGSKLTDGVALGVPVGMGSKRSQMLRRQTRLVSSTSCSQRSQKANARSVSDTRWLFPPPESFGGL